MKREIKMIKNRNAVISFGIIGIILCASLMVSGCADNETYTNEDYGFSVQYPGSWNIEEQTNEDYSQVNITSPEKEAVFMLLVSDVSSLDVTYEDLAESVFGNFELYERFEPETDITRGLITFNGQEAYEVTLSRTDDEKETQYMRGIFFIDNNILGGDKGYFLVYYSTKDERENADKIMDSFTFDTN
nr:PsbP-related protein [uncultured Methanolobus sp.]